MPQMMMSTGDQLADHKDILDCRTELDAAVVDCGEQHHHENGKELALQFGHGEDAGECWGSAIARPAMEPEEPMMKVDIPDI